MKKILFSAFVLCAGTGLFAQTYTPVFKVPPGKQFAITTTVKGNMTQEAMGQTMEMPYDVASASTVVIKTSDKAGADVSMIVDKIRMVMSVMGQEMSYDSEKGSDADNPLGGSFRNYIGKTTTFKVDNAGRVVEGSVVMPAEVKADAGADMGTMVMGSMMLEARGGLPSLFDIFPAGTKAIAIGETVTDKSAAEGSSNVKRSISYTLVELKDGKARFTISGTTQIDGKTEMQGMAVSMATSSKESGEMLIDVATGLLISKTLTSEQTGSLEAAGMQMPVTGKTTVVIEVNPK